MSRRKPKPLIYVRLPQDANKLDELAKRGFVIVILK